MTTTRKQKKCLCRGACLSELYDYNTQMESAPVLSHLAQIFEVDKAFLQANMLPYPLLHSQGWALVHTIDVDGWNLILYRSTPWLQPRDYGLVSLEQMPNALGTWILVVMPRLSSVHNVHARNIQHTARGRSRKW